MEQDKRRKRLLAAGNCPICKVLKCHRIYQAFKIQTFNDVMLN